MLITLYSTPGRFTHAIENWDQEAWGQFNTTITDITYGGDRFVAVGLNGFLATSPDGVDWTVHDKSVLPAATSIAYGDGVYKACGGNTSLYTSWNGISWRSETKGFERNYSGVDFAGGLFVANTDTGESWTYPTVGEWESSNFAAPGKLRSTTFGHELFVAVGDNGTILTANYWEPYGLGNCWIVRESPTVSNLLSVTYGNGVFVATSQQGTVLTSSNGVDWEEQNVAGPDSPLYNVTWGNGYFVVVGAATHTQDGANLWTSTDGTNWTRQHSYLDVALKAVAFDGKRFVAVGEAGAIIRSSVVQPALGAARLTNLSNRAFVGEGENVLIGSMVIADAPLRIYARVAGPSLPPTILNPLLDPELELIQILPTGNIQLGLNFDWRTEQEALIGSTGIPPENDSEPAIVKTLKPGTYSIVVRGAGGTTGFANVEIYAFPDPSEPVQGKLTNMSNRAMVGTGDDVLIGSFIIQGNVPHRIYARVGGPSLPTTIMNPLLNPELELIQILPTGNETLARNSHWYYQSWPVSRTGIPPESPNEPAIVKTLEPGTYSIIVRGEGDTEGIANIEIYDYPEL
ncbi:MAG: hypothetical protein KJT03_18240 [Verrucomicrobiae bacterium]|nr:hypothetical protein [Verrucomicrobiae bacterium]